MIANVHACTLAFKNELGVAQIMENFDAAAPYTLDDRKRLPLL